jgi:hypothetical protein
MTDTPPDWVLIEAAKRSGRNHWTLNELRNSYADQATYAALCDMIWKYEQPPVDRKLLCAREAWLKHEKMEGVTMSVAIGIRAIELWEEGFGK